jgi:hypothetical protein
VPVSETTFELLDLEGQMIFEIDGDGTISGFELWFDVPGWSPYRRWRLKKAES